MLMNQESRTFLWVREESARGLISISSLEEYASEGLRSENANHDIINITGLSHINCGELMSLT